jgi:anion-transporting  ArsA/GET3 family ATPase
MDISEIVQSQRVIVCVGSGGVGKTTTAAAVALAAAQRGRKACVLTIDPARRLADALGVATLGNVPSRVDDAVFAAAGLPAPNGQLWALMLDAKRTWDDLVVRFAQSPAQARRILDNHYYQQISSALAGSQEFMAMEKLFELNDSGGFDLVVVDTPPTRHALDFLDAPKKMMGFVDAKVLEVFLAPGKMGLGMFRTSGAWMFKALQRITGFEVLRDISDFVANFGGMYAGFGERAARVEALLRSSGSTFLLVTSPDPHTVDEAMYFCAKLAEYRMALGGFVVNRVHPESLNGPGVRDAWEHVKGSLDPRTVQNFDRLQALAGLDRVQIDRLQTACPGPRFLRAIPAFDRDIHDLAGLARLNGHLFVEQGFSPAHKTLA